MLEDIIVMHCLEKLCVVQSGAVAMEFTSLVMGYGYRPPYGRACAIDGYVTQTQAWVSGVGTYPNVKYITRLKVPGAMKIARVWGPHITFLDKKSWLS